MWIVLCLDVEGCLLVQVCSGYVQLLLEQWEWVVVMVLLSCLFLVSFVLGCLCCWGLVVQVYVLCCFGDGGLGDSVVFEDLLCSVVWYGVDVLVISLLYVLVEVNGYVYSFYLLFSWLFFNVLYVVLVIIFGMVVVEQVICCVGLVVEMVCLESLELIDWIVVVDLCMCLLC